MSLEDVILVAMIREEIRGGAFRVDVTGIPSHIEMALAEKLNCPMGSNAYWDCPKSGTTGGSDSAEASGVNLNVEVEDAKTTGSRVVPPFGPQHRSAKEGGTNTSDVESYVSSPPVCNCSLICNANNDVVKPCSQSKFQRNHQTPGRE
jgi:hypothetical protein